MPFAFKAGLMALAAIPLVSASPEQSQLAFPNYPQVKRVDCDEGRGTAWRLDGPHWASVAHVTALHDCEIDGLPISVTEQDGGHDFARIDVGNSRLNGLKIDCHGFIAGEWYWSVGFAQGLPFQTAVAVYATYAKAADGKRVLLGQYNFIPGMSGGPVMDAQGNVVGVVNAFIPGTPISLSRELRQTSLCGADIA
jgi:hypothetical protein